MDDGGATVQVTGRFEGGRLRIATDAADHGFRIIRKAKPLYRRAARRSTTTPTASTCPTTPARAGRRSNAADPEILPSDPATAAAATPVKVAVVLLNFSNDATQSPSPPQRTGSCSATPTASPNYFAEESRGAVAMSGHVYGWYTIAATNANCPTAYSTWESQADAKAAAAGVNLSSFDQVVYAWPYAPSCGWAGMGYMPGRDQLEQRLIRPARARPRAVAQLRDEPRQHAPVHPGGHDRRPFGHVHLHGVRRSVLGDGLREHVPQRR